MALFPRKAFQLDDIDNSIQANLEGNERIFSRQDTKMLVRLAQQASSPSQLKRLGKEVVAMLDRQDKKPPEFL